MATTSYGSITVIDTNDIEDVYMLYRGGESNSISPTLDWASISNGDWVRDATQTSGQYIWQTIVIPKSGITIDSANWQQFYGTPVCITSGRSITSTTTQYASVGDSAYVLLVDKPLILSGKPDEWETNWTDYYYYDESDNIYKHLTDSEAPEFLPNIYYDDTWETSWTNYYNYSEYLSLQTEPQDWGTNWASYYSYNSSTNVYEPISTSTAPTFISNTYYDRDVYTQLSGALPNFVPNVYYEFVVLTQESISRLPDSAWNPNPPSYKNATPNYWVKVVNTFDQEPYYEYVYYQDNALTDAMRLAYQAYDYTQQIETDLEGINTTLYGDEDSGSVGLVNSLASLTSNYTDWTSTNKEILDQLEDDMKNYKGHIAIVDNPASITLSSSTEAGEVKYAVQITSGAVNLMYGNDTVAFITGQLFKAPQGYFENIIMGNPQYIANNPNAGELRWIARSNGHLSLKVVK